MTTTRSFGEYLRNKRLSRNLTQRDIAKFVGVDRSAVSKWERNIRTPNYWVLADIMFSGFKLSPRYVSRLVRRWGLV